MAVADGQMGIHVREERMSIYIMEESIVLGIDPGRDKTGFAFADSQGALIASGIFPTNQHMGFFAAVKAGRKSLTQWLTEGDSDSLPEDLTASVKFIAVGDGTHSRDFAELLRNNLPCTLLTVDERNTTLEARNLYWTIHTPSFWTRLLPEGLRVPNRVLDDLAAWAIALRGLKKYRDISPNKL